MPSKRRTPKTTEMVSFRISLSLYKQLEKLNKSYLDHSGRPMSAPMIARQIVLDTLSKNQQDELDGEKS